MDLLLILTYTALCVAIFKIFKIPLNKWTVPTAVLGGIVLIGTLILLMNYNHPHTALGGNVYVTTPIVPNVRGQVVEVPVQANQPLKQGDILFKIDQTRFKARVMEAKAALQDAQQSVLTRQAAYSTAKANTLKALAERDRTKKEFERYQKGAKKGAFTASDVDNKRQIYLAAEASLEAAEAEEDRQLLGITSQINGVDTTVAKAQAALEQAQFDLDSTVVRAPTDGYVTQVTLRPGMMAVPMPLRPVMTFVNEDRTRYVGAFRQNSLLRLKPGFEAEFIFRALPGKTFQGKVVEVLPAIAEGQIQAQGMLMGDKMFSDQGRALVVLEMTDDISEHMLPNGTNVEIAVYSDSFHHVSIMRKVLIRMKSWQNYLYLDH
ncbi:Membrane fusion component of tripartite multidrug resistance system [Grimontia indica]|uniref:Membrane fusion component of tripartite multidrug resistance system n=1 Tax=Grimontia indica TaxID=1056512 RepID=R1GXA7_9GAMM|nr:HlyD family secretion protein [Grimontia indica]EOD80823.1 Membrane fusion component of tripartite multidrug resistance system [Grimontia indica]